METSVNNKCKAFTSLEQSKKLAKILPLESADMYYVGKCKTPDVMSGCKQNYRCYTICWSLAALLDVLESEIDGEEGETYQLNIEKDGTWWNVWYREQYDEANPIETESTEELINACYEMILKLHELNLL